jgi:hypothetical protein
MQVNYRLKNSSSDNHNGSSALQNLLSLLELKTGKGKGKVHSITGHKSPEVE